LFSTARKHDLVNPGGAMILLALATILLAIAVQKNHLLRKLFLRLRTSARGKLSSPGTTSPPRLESGSAGVLSNPQEALSRCPDDGNCGECDQLRRDLPDLKSATAHASFLNAYLVESANRCAQLVASFVPFGLGVDEGTTTATLRSLGRSLSEGVSVAIIRKIRSLFWDFVGLGLAAHFMMARREQSRGTPLAQNQREDVPQALAAAIAGRIP